MSPFSSRLTSTPSPSGQMDLRSAAHLRNDRKGLPDTLLERHIVMH